jgi:hypothetical protein
MMSIEERVARLESCFLAYVAVFTRADGLSESELLELARKLGEGMNQMANGLPDQVKVEKS